MWSSPHARLPRVRTAVHVLILLTSVAQGSRLNWVARLWEPKSSDPVIQPSGGKLGNSRYAGNLLSESSKEHSLPSSLGLKQQQLDVLGLDSIASVFSRDAVSRVLEDTESGKDADFDLSTAKIFAKLVSVSYCSNSRVIQAWNCTRCMRVPTFAIHTVVFDTVWSLVAYVGYLPEKDAIVAVFRGTDNHQWANWLENLRFWSHQAMWPLPDAPQARVHAGFYNMWTLSQLKPNMTAAIAALLKAHPSASLYVTGHSMGAALAQLCALDAKASLKIAHVHAFTFGSPRVGNRAFEELANEQIESSWRFTHNRDVVPSLPPTFIGYHHVAREIWTIDVEPPIPGGDTELNIRVCDGSGEDPSCHNSACLLGLCTSIMDHLTYLQYEMYRRDEEC